MSRTISFARVDPERCAGPIDTLLAYSAMMMVAR